ncbi:U8 snoRNA-decapping enzyme-like [Macrobrachium nipponense]|uniref:U8 snoRNA-decapping enzyme-like n=1 Tax=Macrobrachium nipponense TaxID=159736 RepID=UPI0030C7F0AE
MTEEGKDVRDLPLPEIPRCLQIRTVTKSLISYADSLKYSTYRLAAHACIWAPTESVSLFGDLRALVMMHLRFDGTFGFPGGLIESEEDIVNGLNREMAEEIGWDTEVQSVTWKDYHSSQVDHDKNLVLHFFITKIPESQYADLEKKCLLAPEYGNEVFGTVRVPLYTMANLYSGLPAFLNNKFVGTAKQQLLLTLFHMKIMTEEEIGDAMYKSQNLKLAPNRF